LGRDESTLLALGFIIDPENFSAVRSTSASVYIPSCGYPLRGRRTEEPSRDRSARAESVRRESGPSSDVVSKVPRFSLRGLFHRRKSGAALQRLPRAPAVVLSCERCGFDYTLTRIDFGEGRVGIFWRCRCGSRYEPPGGSSFSGLVKP